jgi:NAD(P)-dependent dehydrogenase (short-subunit alcohol dehydrogenase family)
MAKFVNKLVGKDIIVVGGTSGFVSLSPLHNFHANQQLTKPLQSSIGYGAASAFLASGAHVTVISSSPARVDAAVSRLSQEHDGPHIAGAVADVRDEAAFVEVLRGLAPVDHVVFSGVDRIIRGKLAEMDLEEAKWLFGVKFWGAVVVGKGMCVL